jgi:hypothetical protein
VHALFIIASVLPARSAIAATISNVIFIGDPRVAGANRPPMYRPLNERTVNGRCTLLRRTTLSAQERLL